MTRALVLEGGGARGAFQAGVLLYLADHPRRFRPDLVCGTSVGALNAAAFAFGLVPELVATWCRLLPRHVYRRRSVLRHAAALLLERRFTHLYDTTPLRRLLESVFGARTLRESPILLRITAFNVQTGRPEVLDGEAPVRVVDALLASTAVQGLFPPVELGGFQYLDGANGSNLPLLPALEKGATDVLLLRAARREPLTPWPYRDVVSLQKRAHLSLMARLTRSDLSRAREVTTALRRHEARMGRVRLAAEELRDPEERARFLRLCEGAPPLLPGRREVRLRVISPPRGGPVPDLLDFDPATSLRLLRLGYAEARRRFARAGRKGESHVRS